MAEGFGEGVMNIHLRNCIGDVLNVINYYLPCPEHVTGETLNKCINILEYAHILTTSGESTLTVDYYPSNT